MQRTQYSRKKRAKGKGKKREKKSAIKDKEFDITLAPFSSRTSKQAQLCCLIDTSDLIVVTGSAGTGKTFTVCAKASEYLATKKVNKIVISAPNISVGKSYGSIPGELDDKMAPWVAPMQESLKKHLKGSYTYALANGQIITTPIESIRGKTFNNSFIIIDEAQQLTIEQIEALATRVGDRSTICFMGDKNQNDLGSKSALGRFVEMLRHHDIPGHSLVHFTEDDIVRSGLCKHLVKMFNKELH